MLASARSMHMRVALALSALTLVSAQTSSPTSTPTGAPTTYAPTAAPYVCSTSGDFSGKQCQEITVSSLNITDGICIWTNLAGQTPDGNAYQNFPYLNNFACNNDATTTTNLDSCASADLNFPTPASPYYALMDTASNATEIAVTTAREYYASFNKALSRYNCEEQYSHWNCDDCRKAYARWSCAMMMPACTSPPCAQTNPCENMCFDVVRKCPVTLGFSCPDDGRDYWATGCNSMGMASGAATNRVFGIVALVPILAAAWRLL